MARTRQANYLFSAPIGGGRVELYDSTGRFVRTFGRRGAGPGEFGALSRVLVGPADTILVVDDGNVRVQVLTPEGDYVRSFPAPARHRSLAVKGDVLAFYRPPSERSDSTFVLLDMQGNERGRFATAPSASLQTAAGSVAPARDGGWWTTRYWHYELVRRDSNGTPVEALIRKVDWFPPDAPFPTTPGQRPPPALYHVWEAEGLVWAYTVIPDPKWKPGVPDGSTPEGYANAFDTMVEVFDPVAATVVATTRHPSRISPACNAHLVYHVVEMSDGDTRVQLLRPTLVGAPAAGRQ